MPESALLRLAGAVPATVKPEYWFWQSNAFCKEAPLDSFLFFERRFRILLENLAMTLLKRFSALFLPVLLAFFVGCASTPKHEGTGEYVDDTVLTTKVKAAILNEPSLKSAEINVETFKGVVQLSGFVSSQTASYRAVEVARGVLGVKSVKNDMRIKGQQ